MNTAHSLLRPSVFIALLLLGGSFTRAQDAPVSIEAARYQALEWRNIGPFRGGRVTTVAGVAAQPLVYYMGATGGGVWKTEDAGNSWRNISDGFFKTGSVGAIAVADSDANVIYVGMGEAPIRGVATSHGDGVYRSTDAGRTWQHLGLAATRHISQVIIHPRNPDVVYVAAQGSPWGPNPERGVYRTTDGGKTWARVHHVDATTGVADLSMDVNNPRVLYAAYWDHQRTPWQVRSGGPGSAIYKTTDGGETWSKLTEGLPKGVLGKIAVSVSPANSDRVWALIEAEDGGLFRSEDAGKTWRRINEDRLLRARAWYYINVFADPLNADTVYVLNAPFLKSIDGGRTFQNIPVPHGDNHALWINPRNAANLINGNDGGANISFNGGRTWSTQANQPTAQFYRVITDNQFPYFVYGGQQDNSTVAIASRSASPGITEADWHEVGGCENAHIAFNPNDPTLIYAGCYQGLIDEFDRRTRRKRNVMAYPAQGLAEPSHEQKYRFNWNAPILISPHDPKVIYHAGNVLLRSDNRGRTWTASSPDLTRNEKDKQGAGGAPITNEGAGGEVYNTIFYVAESPHQAGVIWAGTDDGLLHLTRDNGQRWERVTPPGIGEAQINSIEVSPHDPATAYVTATAYKRNDFTPHIFKTSDYGKTWRRSVTGIRPGDFVRVVREDPARKGLLYAGTETGVYVSFDDGANWQSLQLNLPVVPITDLTIRNHDLVAATQGRAFWILDDLTPLHQLPQADAGAYLFKPRAAYRDAGGPRTGARLRPAEGMNPPSGAIIYYQLAATPPTDVTLEIVDGGGQVIRKFASTERKAPGVMDAPGAAAPPRLPAKAGLNRFVWDLRSETITRVPGVNLSAQALSHRVAPGTYQARLTAGGKTLTQTFDVLADPRVKVDAADYRAQHELAATIHRRVNELHQAVIRLRDVREQINKLIERTASHPHAATIATAGKALGAKITAWEETVIQPRQKTAQDVINYRNQLNDQYLFLAEAVDEGDPPVTEGMRARFADLEAQWAVRRAALTRLEQDVAAFGALLKEKGVAALLMQ